MSCPECRRFSKAYWAKQGGQSNNHNAQQIKLLWTSDLEVKNGTSVSYSVAYNCSIIALHRTSQRLSVDSIAQQHTLQNHFKYVSCVSSINFRVDTHTYASLLDARYLGKPFIFIINYPNAILKIAGEGLPYLVALE